MLTLLHEQEILPVLDEILPLYELAYPAEDPGFFRWRVEASIGQGLNSLLILSRSDDAQNPEVDGWLFGFDYREDGWWAGEITPWLPANLRWGEPRFELNEIVVHPKSRGKGLATSLLKALFALDSYPTVALSVHVANAPARKLYERCGFEVVVPEMSFSGETEKYAVLARTSKTAT